MQNRCRDRADGHAWHREVAVIENDAADRRLRRIARRASRSSERSRESLVSWEVSLNQVVRVSFLHSQRERRSGPAVRVGDHGDAFLAVQAPAPFSYCERDRHLPEAVVAVIDYDGDERLWQWLPDGRDLTVVRIDNDLPGSALRSTACEDRRPLEPHRIRLACVAASARAVAKRPRRLRMSFRVGRRENRRWWRGRAGRHQTVV